MHEFFHLLFRLIIDTQSTLDMLVTNYGTWVYAILFVVIFCETGLIVTPFLPGDSILFLAATIAHRKTNDLNIVYLILILIIAAVLGDAINYIIGYLFGRKLFANPNSRVFKQSYLIRTTDFYARHGGKTIILARFIPIIRTFAPFVAGMGRMSYKYFASFNIIGGVLWVLLFTLLGYCAGGLDIVQHNLKFVVVLIILISVLPPIITFVRNKIVGRRCKSCR